MCCVMVVRSVVVEYLALKQCPEGEREMSGEISVASTS